MTDDFPVSRGLNLILSVRLSMDWKCGKGHNDKQLHMHKFSKSLRARILGIQGISIVDFLHVSVSNV